MGADITRSVDVKGTTHILSLTHKHTQEERKDTTNSLFSIPLKKEWQEKKNWNGSQCNEFKISKILKY